MLIAGTVIADPETVIPDGAVVVEGETIAAVGDAEILREAYPDHERRDIDIVAPGLVGGHVHSVQSLGRGIADDAALLDWLFDAVLPMEAAMDAGATRAAAELGYLECLESGTTTVVDHLSVNHAEEAFEAAIETGIRARLGKVLMDRDSPEGLLEDTDAALAESEALIEEYHGAADGRVRYAVTPRFAVTCSEACLRGCRDLVDRHDGVTIHTHASENEDEIETVEADTGKRNVLWLDEVGLTGPDVTLAHCVHTDEREREVLAETDTVVTHCPSSNMKLASGIAPVQDYLDRGITVALGNDGPPCNNTLDPFTEMRQASLLGKVDARDPTRLPASTVLEMATTNGAHAAGFDRLGTLREGQRADVIGITTDRTRATPLHDPLSHLVYAAHGDDVVFTMVDGRIRYDDGEHVGIDADAVRERATRHAKRVVEEAGIDTAES
ncbi:5'-deoxyadenosine deaminase [Halorubrum lacusprofundi]|jgi:cytosine/adenosine deaminase-related metal-dependent hydrolase|uniref:Amidohydrolase n=1 Tax=Halorubrum lacusprofundi (strain ATCC 49239 / DSM 5036 / JCM 8891 / ACAM 34) TaxID=416348 RepID=B9LRQ4_HALLT|nr:5'-deoxyadenosine deaminase [Halorubrum lacusprofundi]ACM57778.1 amidohydrolase [Halorubrum lacusprofundi ATCC 49239]MCG1007067.1 5'-deoxyadenosine deaminase [Halorubrum lacusprofundi]